MNEKPGIPLQSELARDAKEVFGAGFLLESGFDLSEAERKYGKTGLRVRLIAGDWRNWEQVEQTIASLEQVAHEAAIASETFICGHDLSLNYYI